MVTLKNPTGNEVSVVYKGVSYTIPANGAMTLPSDVADYWKTRIHQFLIDVAEEAQKAEPVTETKETKAEEIAAMVEKKLGRSKKN